MRHEYISCLPDFLSGNLSDSDKEISVKKASFEKYRTLSKTLCVKISFDTHRKTITLPDHARFETVVSKKGGIKKKPFRFLDPPRGKPCRRILAVGTRSDLFYESVDVHTDL